MGYDAFFWAALVGLVLLTMIRLDFRLADPARGPHPGVAGVAVALFVLGAAAGFLQVLFAPSRDLALIDASRFLTILRQVLVITGYVLIPFLFPQARTT